MNRNVFNRRDRIDHLYAEEFTRMNSPIVRDQRKICFSLIRRMTFLLLTIISSVVLAQIPMEFTNSSLKTGLFQPTLLEQQPVMEATILEAPIHPDEYIVGPGDRLSINIWGASNTDFDVQITPEGITLIPTVAEIDLQELSLAQTKEKIIQTVKKVYLNSEVTVNLISLRKFRVTVSGQVENPGSITVTAADRVSEAIRLANPVPEGKEPLHVENVTTKKAPVPVIVKKEPAKRQIILTRKNGQKLPIDLLGYEINGKKEKNPYLLEGDVIYVPLFTKNIPTVQILGAVHDAGTYEFMEGDRVMDIVKIAHGFTYNADSSNIEISRFNADNKTITSFKIDLSSYDMNQQEEENNVLLKVDDRIYVRYIPEYHRINTVEIKGEIMYPGYYSIELDETKLTDIIETAGGFTESASLKEAFVIRRKLEEIVDLEYERLSAMSVEEMTSMEREYYKIKNRERRGIMAVDFIRLFVDKDTTLDITLHHNDYIEIPLKAQVVNISGQVVRPGLIAFEKGKSLSHYIRKAGGYSWNANRKKVRVIRTETGEWAKPENSTIINVGDTILIPEKTERNNWVIFKDVLSTTVQIATLVLVVQSTTK